MFFDPKTSVKRDFGFFRVKMMLNNQKIELQTYGLHVVVKNTDNCIEKAGKKVTPQK